MRAAGVFLLGVALIAGFTMLVVSTHEWGLGTRPWLEGTTRVRWQHLVEDIHDRGVYQQRGRWLPAGVAPYIGEHSEYPQIATWMVAVPYLFIDHHVPAGGYDQTRDAKGKRTITKAEQEHLAADREAYFDTFHVAMGVCAVALLAILLALLRTVGAAPGWALLMFLPGSLYFTFNRYDVVPAAMVALALLFQLRHHAKTAAFVLAIAAMTKWYPILLLPMFASYSVRRAMRGGATFGAALKSGMVVPGLVAGFTCAAILAVTWFWDGGGLDAVKYVYTLHAGRNPNPSSLVSALTAPHRWGWLTNDDRSWLGLAIAALQFGPAVVLALFPVRSRHAMLWGCLTVVIGFVTFSKVFSPQWIVWITPIAILLVARSKVLLALLVSLEVLIYVQMPVMYYAGPAEVDGAPALMQPLEGFWAVCDARIAVLVSVWAWSLVMFLRTVFARTAVDPHDAEPTAAIPSPS